MPLSVIMLFVLWIFIVFLFPSQEDYLYDIDNYLRNEKKALGHISASEKKLIILYSLLILLWFTKSLHGMSISMSALLITPFVFFPKVNIIEWETAKNNIDWGVPLLFASGFSIALALNKSGLTDVMRSFLAEYSKIFSGFLFPVMLVLLLIFLRFFFTNYTAMVASLMPVMFSFAVSSSFNPVWIGLLFLVSSSTSFLLPSQSAGNMLTFSTRYYSSKDLLLLGSLFTLALILVTYITAFFYWPLVGIPISK